MKLDVAVVGASSSGLYAAELLAKGGAKVAVFERQPRLRPAQRTLIVTQEFCRLLGTPPSDVAQYQSSRFALNSSRGSRVVSLAEPDLIVERATLIPWLAARAQAAGAEIHFSSLFQGAVANGSGVSLQFDAGSRVSHVLAGALVGADGSGTSVGRVAGARTVPSVPLQQAEVRRPADWPAEVTTVWFRPRDTSFFFWYIPHSDTHGVVGVIGDGRHGAREVLDGFLSEHELAPVAYQSGNAAMHHPSLRPWGRIGRTPVYLIGDAAGQVKTTTVGGTVTGLLGAEAATRAILEDQPYPATLRRLKRELDLHWFLRLILARLTDKGYDRLLDCLTPHVQGLLATHNRDRMSAFFWRLAAQPKLAGVALYALIGLVTVPFSPPPSKRALEEASQPRTGGGE